MSDKTNDTDSACAAPAAEKKRKPRTTKPRKLPPYHVILLNDDYHTYEYVIEMLKALFGYEKTHGFRLARQVDRSGRAIVLTTTKEHAELKRDQIHAYGRDDRVQDCAGSMSAKIEPAET